MDEKTVVIIGATGSIGTQALDVLKKLGKFKLVGFTYHRNRELAEEIKSEYPEAEMVSTIYGNDEFVEMMERLKPDIAVAAAPGFSGFELAYLSIPYIKRLALANKESLVCGGKILKELLKKYNVELVPIDSEHSAVFQLMEKEISRIAITASGGALRDWPLEELNEAKPSDVLKHPVWSMGKRITVDSATMVNKALEVLEAMELFEIERERVDVYIHREGLIHGMVFLKDGTVKIHASKADMRIPIAYSLTYPERILFYESHPEFSRLTFEKPQRERYPLFFLVDHIKDSYALRTAFNAADEIAVDGFLRGKIKYTDIFRVVEKVLERIDEKDIRSFEDLKVIDEKARRLACEEIRYC
jgi:1-deoxy-D-xylulose-5-phosphate reductoisomerase